MPPSEGRDVTQTLLQWLNGGAGSSVGGASAAPFAVWLVVLSDVLIGLSYYSISLALAYYVISRPGRKTNWMIITFAVFIFASGTTHLLTVWTMSRQALWIAAIMKLTIAVVSAVTAIWLWPMMARVLKAPSQTLEQLHSAIQQLKHEVAERLRAEQALHKSQELLRQLAAYQEQIKEDERKRIAREIHDELGQNLMALRIDASMLQARTIRSHPRLNEKVRLALVHIDTIIKAVRAIINNLRPSVLDLGLHAAIDWQVNEFERRTGIACKLEMEGDDRDVNLDETRATALFRIVQESLSNVARHAQASQVHIKLGRDGSRLIMKIADDGVGMFPGNRRKPNSFGLLGIEERISALGGAFAINSMPGEGTVLNLSIPVDADSVDRPDKPADHSHIAVERSSVPVLCIHQQQGPHVRPL
jgi:signal transduction histidine kinase